MMCSGSGAVSRWLMTVAFSERHGSALPGPSDTTLPLMKREHEALDYTRANQQNQPTHLRKPVILFGFLEKLQAAKELHKLLSRPHLGLNSLAYLGQTSQADQGD